LVLLKKNNYFQKKLILINKDRGINGILEAMNKFKLNNGLILTYYKEDELKTKENKNNSSLEMAVK